MVTGITASGWGLENWDTIGNIVLSWLISPLSSGAIAAAFLYITKRSITYRSEMTEAAARVVPLLIAVMAWPFGTDVMLKGLGQLVHVSFIVAVIDGGAIAAVVLVLVRKPVARLAQKQDNRKQGVNRLFTWPLVYSAASLSFAHSANDVANAVGPLAAIYEAVKSGAIATKAATPMWVMVLGALGLSVRLTLYGARLIKTVCKEITEIDNMRAHSIAMAATITVIFASQLGMPISTTHVTIGAVFGAGFLRELLKVNHSKTEAVVFCGPPRRGQGKDSGLLATFSDRRSGGQKAHAGGHEAAHQAARAELKARFLPRTSVGLSRRLTRKRLSSALLCCASWPPGSSPCLQPQRWRQSCSRSSWLHWAEVAVKRKG